MQGTTRKYYIVSIAATVATPRSGHKLFIPDSSSSNNFRYWSCSSLYLSNERHPCIHVSISRNNGNQAVLVLVLHVSLFRLCRVNEHIGVVSADARRVTFRQQLAHFNQNQPDKREKTYLAKLSKTRSNLGDEQNSAARVTMDNAMDCS